MPDRYQALIRTSAGQLLARRLGLPNPPQLERWAAGQPLVDGAIVLGGDGRLEKTVAAALDELGIHHSHDAAATVAKPDADSSARRLKGLVFDATGLTSSEQLVALHRFFHPLLRTLDRCSRVVVLGVPPESCQGPARVSQRALEGFTRSLGKEIGGRGGTAQLVYVAHGAHDRPTALMSTLGFLLSPKSAYVSGQVVRIGCHGADDAAEKAPDATRPLQGKVALVTGAGRGIGEQIARVLHRDGAHVIGVDVAQAATELQALTRELDGDPLILDITTKDAPQRIAHQVAGGAGQVDIVVHNAGITRDKRLVNMQEDAFASTVAVNLTAPERITAELLSQGLIASNGRIVGIASIAGIAGNLGQTNYATSKAGVIGLVDSLAGALPDGITVNAIAPGFIETQMTAAMPLASREVGRRINALSQAGLPIDVAETVAWLAHPGSTAVTGNVIRVCGQMMLGA